MLTLCSYCSVLTTEKAELEGKISQIDTERKDFQLTGRKKLEDKRAVAASHVVKRQDETKKQLKKYKAAQAAEKEADDRYKVAETNLTDVIDEDANRGLEKKTYKFNSVSSFHCWKAGWLRLMTRRQSVPIAFLEKTRIPPRISE